MYAPVYEKHTEDFLQSLLSENPLEYYDYEHALMYASKKGYLKQIKLLTLLSVIGNEAYQDAFLWAAANNKMEVAQFFIQNDKFEIDAETYAGALRLSCDIGSLEMIELLLPLLPLKNIFMQEGIARASDKGHLNVVKFLVEQSSLLDINYSVIYASEKDYLEIVKFLCTCDFKLSSWAHEEAFKRACKNNHLKTAQFLSKGLDINAFAFYNSPLSVASSNGHLEVLKFLSTLGEVDFTIGENFPLFLASLNGYLKIVKFLVTLPGVLAGKDKAIKAASKKGHFEVAEFLKNLKT